MKKMLSDWLALIERHLQHLRLVKERLISLTLLPTLFVLVFGVMFSSAISIPGGGYREFIMSGIFVQIMISALPGSAIGAIEDLRTGLVDRFRSLPMSGSAVLVGRCVGDTAMRVISVVPMAIVGYLIGWRIHTGVLSALAGFGVLLLFGFVLAWVGAFLGLALRTPETAASLPALVLMPALFLSNAFVPLAGLPVWLRTVAEWNPLSAVVGASRVLWGNPTALASDAFPTRHPVLMTLFWLTTTMLIVSPLAARKYRTATVR